MTKNSNTAMVQDTKTLLDTAERIRAELINLWQDYLISSVSVYNKHGLRRARSVLRKFNALSKEYSIATRAIHNKTRAELKAFEQQKTTL